MPYNPSSAYPRHSTYTPPVEGRGFARGFNDFDWGQKFGHPNQMPGVDVGHAIRAGSQRPTTEGIQGALTAQNRVGPLSRALDSANRQVAQMRDTRITRSVWNRAEHGDDPNEMGSAGEPVPTEIDTRTPEGRAAAAKIDWKGNRTGGREHVGPVNDRLDDIEQRETRTSAMNDTVNKVLTGTVGGPMSVPKPKLVFGPFRRRK